MITVCIPVYNSDVNALVEALYEQSKNIKEKIELFISETHFDIHGISATPSFDQSYVVKLITRITVSATTAFWSFLELKDYLNQIKKTKSRRN